MSELTNLHAGLARALVLYLAFIGVWGLVAWRRGSGISPSYRGALVIAWITALAQGVFGLALWIGGTGPRDPLHILYGFALAAALPAAAWYFIFNVCRVLPRRGQNTTHKGLSLPDKRKSYCVSCFRPTARKHDTQI